MTIQDIIRARHEDIMRRWTEAATRVASARGLEQPEFRNMMPRFLDSLTTSPLGPGALNPERRSIVESHVAARLRQGFHAAEVVEEFQLLGRCVLEEAKALPEYHRLTPKEVDLLLTEFHLASVHVLDQFSQQLEHEEQTDKRFIRLIQKVAGETLEPTGTPLRERLGEVLSLVMEAMGAQSAAILLYESDSQRLVTAASTGAGNEYLERYATSLDPGSFVGKIATGGPDTTEADVCTTVLKVNDSLRAHDIRSLLGVRLPPYQSLLGVLYVGISEARDFSAQERRRIEVLADRLALHLNNARLYADRQAKVDALNAERAVRARFVSVLAHDLRGPLAAAKLNAQRLARQPANPGDDGSVARRIEENLERADRMIRDLLDANRLQAGKALPLELEPCDLRAIAQEVVDELRDLDGESLLLDAPEPVAGIWSPGLLRRALWNLVGNALKYGAPGQPITVRVAKGGQGALASVHNSGNPIPFDEQAHLFEQFSRTRSSEAGQELGWGLGLTLVRGCAEAHSGRVDVRSNPEEGTTFTIELPLDSRHAQPEDEGATSPEAGEAPLPV